MKSAPLLLSLALLGGCVRTPGESVPATTPTTTAGSLDPATLGRYHWQLANARDAQGQSIEALFARNDYPVQLDFSEGRIGIGNTCNHMGGGYSLQGGTLKIERLASTLMACADRRLMALDEAAGRLLQGSLAATLETRGTPLLTLTTAGGDVLEFTGNPTVETRYGGPGERMFLEVAPQRVACLQPMMPAHRCLSVREIVYDGNGLKQSEGQWQPFQQEIEGYQHEPGIRNVLRVKRFQREPSAADASTFAYVLDMVVESENTQP